MFPVGENYFNYFRVLRREDITYLIFVYLFFTKSLFWLGYFVNDNLNTFWRHLHLETQKQHKQPTYPRDINLCQHRKYGNIRNLLSKLENDQIDKIENGYE